MKFESRSEAEIVATEIWPSGVVDFVVVEAHEKMSRNGNKMIELQIEVSGRKDGRKRMVRDFLLPQRAMKLLHACRTCGIEDKYESGLISEDDFVGETGKLKLGIERATAEFPRRNVVIDYV